MPGAPLDNNICERALKKAILHRKNALFFKTENGAHVGDIFMSLICTCELCGANPFDYLTKLERHADELATAPTAGCPGTTVRRPHPTCRHRPLTPPSSHLPCHGCATTPAEIMQACRKDTRSRTGTYRRVRRTMAQASPDSRLSSFSASLAALAIAQCLFRQRPSGL